MISQHFEIPPIVSEWLNKQELSVPVQYLKHDFANGYAVGFLLNKLYGEKYETRTLENNTSLKCKKHNWARIYQQYEVNKSKFTLNDQIIEEVIGNDELATLNLLISIYEGHTNSVVLKTQYPTIPRFEKQVAKQPTPKNIISTKEQDNFMAQNAIPNDYPSNIPMFARGCYKNSSELINSLNESVQNALQEFPELCEYLEMLDPRADFCYPFPQLLLRLPINYCFLVCQSFLKTLEADTIRKCCLEDFSLFEDVAMIILEAVIAVNQREIDRTEVALLFDGATDFLVKVVKNIQSDDKDCSVLIYNIIMKKIIKQIYLVNFSLPHYFRLCLACCEELNEENFNEILSSSVSNLKYSCPIYSENRLRLEVLRCFTVFSQQNDIYKEQISYSAIKFTLHSILLPNIEKYLSMDLFVRCVVLNPSLLGKFQFVFLRNLSFLINKTRRTEPEDESDENMLFEGVKIELKSFQFEFSFNNVLNLNYEQLLYIIIMLKKLNAVQAEYQSNEIKLVYNGLLESIVAKRDNIPICFYLLGLTALCAEKQDSIEKSYAEIVQILKGESDLQRKLQDGNNVLKSNQVKELVESLTSIFQDNINTFNAVFSVLSGNVCEEDVLSNYARAHGFEEDDYIQIGIFDGIHLQVNDAIYEKIEKTLFSADCAAEMALLVLFCFVQRFTISNTSLRLLIYLNAMNKEVVEFCFDYLKDELFPAVLADSDDVAIGSCDALLVLFQQIDLAANQEDIVSSLFALIDFSFNLQASEVNDTIARKSIQQRFMRLLGMLEVKQEFNAILLELVEKMDFDDYGNDELGQFINGVRGEI